MPRRLTLNVASALALALIAIPVRAQDAPKAESPKPPTEAARLRGGPGATLRVQVVISRFQGERKVMSLPYTLSVTAEGQPARMRMGVDTPVAVTTAVTEAGIPAPKSIQYRNVGTNIDCRAKDAGEGRYQLLLGVENSSALPLEKGPGSGSPGVDANPTGSPLFRRFDTNIDPVLRDGQTVQAIASTDPVTGEVVKIDVTLYVVK